MNFIYAPGRSSYFKDGSLKTKKRESCLFCEKIAQENDRENLILKRTKNSVIMLNLYPYNAGHILVLPYMHTAELSILSQEDRSQLMDDINHSVLKLEAVLSCEGINIGINKGKVSGGSVADHLHVHVVPRYSNDTNFMMVCDATKVVGMSPLHMYDILKKHFDE